MPRMRAMRFSALWSERSSNLNLHATTALPQGPACIAVAHHATYTCMGNSRTRSTSTGVCISTGCMHTYAEVNLYFSILVAVLFAGKYN